MKKKKPTMKFPTKKDWKTLQTKDGKKNKKIDTPSDHFGPFQPLTVKKQDSISFSPEMPTKAKELKGSNLRSNE